MDFFITTELSLRGGTVPLKSPSRFEAMRTMGLFSWEGLTGAFHQGYLDNPLGRAAGPPGGHSWSCCLCWVALFIFPLLPVLLKIDFFLT